MIPKSKPKATRGLIEAIIADQWRHTGAVGAIPAVCLVGVRGYYSETFAPAGNNRSVYDDALFIVGPETFAAWNANTDPSAWKPKVATLKTGIHWYRPGKHGISRPGGGYPAFRPATKNEELPVTRDGASVPWPGVAINIHRGGRNTTSSEGCQTIPPDQWDAFHAVLMRELKAAGQKTFPYVLVDGPIA